MGNEVTEIVTSGSHTIIFAFSCTAKILKFHITTQVNNFSINVQLFSLVMRTRNIKVKCIRDENKKCGSQLVATRSVRSCAYAPRLYFSIKDFSFSCARTKRNYHSIFSAE